MSNEKMTELTLSGPIDRLDEAVRRFVVDKPFHPEDAAEFLAGVRRLRRIEAEDVYTPLIARADALLAAMGLEPAFAEHGDYEPEETAAYFDGLSAQLTVSDTASDAAEEIDADDRIVQLLRQVPESLRDLNDLKYVRCRIGLLDEDKWPEVESFAAERTDILAVKLSAADGEIGLLALALPEALDELDGNLSRLGFEHFRPEAGHKIPDCTAEELITRAEAKKAAAAEREAEDAAKRKQLIETEGGEVLRRRSWLAYEAACARAKGFAARNTGRFYIVGWASEKDAASMEAEAEASGFSCVISKPREVKKAKPPVQIREGGVRSILSPLMKMYGLPAYGTADPRIFMVITYTLFFGMMFGDAGQGACIALLGFLMYKKSGSWLWRILSLCGCSAVVFGLIYGSVFGLEELLPWGGYHPLEAEHIMPVLLAGAALGVVVILVCMAFNIVNSLRLGDLKSAFFSPNGLAGAVLYTAIIAGIVCSFTGIANLFTGAYILLLIVLPIVLIWLSEPLGKLVSGEKKWQPESWGMCIVEGFFDIFESAISYMSNTMSFLRVGAFAISHAGMMMVVSMLTANASATGSVIIMILGNAFVAALEAALSSIQIIRLEFYEIFGRFYVGGGREFSPVTAEYTK